MNMDRRFMVMQYLGELRTLTPWGTPCQFRVFRCGDDKWLLMDPIDLHGCSIMQQFPVLRSRIVAPVRRAFTLKTGGLYTTAARNAYDANRVAIRDTLAKRAVAHAALGQALDVFHAA